MVPVLCPGFFASVIFADTIGMWEGQCLGAGFARETGEKLRQVSTGSPGRRNPGILRPSSHGSGEAEKVMQGHSEAVLGKRVK